MGYRDHGYVAIRMELNLNYITAERISKLMAQIRLGSTLADDIALAPGKARKKLGPTLPIRENAAKTAVETAAVAAVNVDRRRAAIVKSLGDIVAICHFRHCF